MSRDWFAGGLVALALCLAPLAATPETPGADDATPASDAVSAAREAAPQRIRPQQERSTAASA